MNISDVFRYHARRQPEVPALIDGLGCIRFGELDDLIGRTAAHLAAIGLRPGDRVGCALKEGADHIVLLLGMMRAGLVYVPLDWRAPPAEWDRMVARFSLSAAFVTDGTPALSIATIVVDGEWHGAVAQIVPGRGGIVGGDAPAMISLSSGTTGEPGAVEQTHRALFLQNTSRWNSIDHAGPRRYFSALPLYFTAGRQLILDHLVHGATVILYPALFSAEEFVEQVTRHQATITLVVPTVMRWLLDLPASRPCLLPDLKALLIGAAAIHGEEKLAALDHVSPRTHEVYGATGAGWISVARPEDIRLHPDSVGLPAFLMERQLVDSEDRLVETGEIGMLRCKGPSISGTDGDLGGWLYTGDLARENADGFMFLEGRSADLIIRAGANVLPEEVERVLLSHKDVSAAAVVGWPSRILGEEVAAFVVMQKGGAVDELRELCRTSLAPYKVPSEIFQLDRMPLTTSGKIKKRELVAKLPEPCES